MQLNLGTKIRELRRRDGRTQEMLAEFLGVTGQAVSRWESGGSYPDMEMIPAIANFFHVSIDELFGYDNDREEKIRRMVNEANRAMAVNGRSLCKGCLPDDFARCIDMLRDGAREFPNEPRILLELASALHHWGWSQYGARSNYNEATEAYEDDVAYNAQNEYWQEAVSILEKTLGCELHPLQRSLATLQLVNLYRRMGTFDKAKALAVSQNDVRTSKELMLCAATTGEEKARYRAEGLLELLGRTKALALEFVAMNPKASFPEYGRPLLLAFAQVYERIFADGRCGLFHLEMGLLYRALADMEARREGDSQNVLLFFDKAFDHFNAYAHLCDEGEYAYTAPLVSAMEPVTKDQPVALGKVWEHELQGWPEDILSELRRNPKYAAVFA